MLWLQDLHLVKVILFAIGFTSVLLSICQVIDIFDISHLSALIGGVVGALTFTLSYKYLKI